ncbi:hypothetical protein [Cupriavidus malaysiensis]|uniref:AP2/ERF domain-containing protein n=1 Tax=Cupriavidus malaysiensis TaxID=367825 RepID=A0ABN4THX1_9BURK|nr:hypothetical protein [Cupriavidus malaysiensis]AOZ06794.1 hypothetical protein BKK80_13925 [Cupriavidus malaysiensis]
MTPTSAQIGLLQHTLGISERHREPHRNHFVAGPGHHDMPDLEQLEAAGLMVRGYRPAFLPESSIVFYTTEAGRALAITSLPEPRKRTRYEEYLDADGCAGDSFGEFLCGIRLPEFETRWHRDYGTWKEHYQYRMFRRDGYGREVQGDWAPTKKEAKASYKAALKARRQAMHTTAWSPA